MCGAARRALPAGDVKSSAAKRAKWPPHAEKYVEMVLDGVSSGIYNSIRIVSNIKGAVVMAVSSAKSPLSPSIMP